VLATENADWFCWLDRAEYLWWGLSFALGQFPTTAKGAEDNDGGGGENAKCNMRLN